MARIFERVMRWLRRRSHPSPHTQVTETADDIREGLGLRMAPGPGALTSDAYEATVEDHPADDA